MTRRILLVLLTFTAAVLVGAVVPLTLDAASHDRTSFIQATAGLARTDTRVLLLRGARKREVLVRALEGDDVSALPVRAAFGLPGEPLRIHWAP